MSRDDAALDAALRALEAGDDRAALEHLVTQWPELRDPFMARLIERLATQVDTREPGIPARMKSIGRMRAAAATKELVALHDELEPHPVVARWLLELLERACHNPDHGAHLTSHAFWIVVARLLSKHAHAGFITQIEDIAKRLSFTAYLRTDVRDALDSAFADVRVIVTPAKGKLASLEGIATLLDARDRARQTAGRTGAELLAAIYADPDQDGPRIVLADWLSERDDPRGEFIVLQIERHRRRTTRTSPDERRLLATHGELWLGLLAPIVRKQGLRFERGFLAACHVFAPSVAIAERLRDAPEWATVEDLSLDNDNYGVLPANLRAIRRLTGLSKSAEHVFGQPDRFRSLVHLGTRIGPKPVVETCPGFRSLREIDVEGSYSGGIDPAGFRWLWSTQVGAQLEQFSIGSGPSTIARWLAEDAAHRMPVTRFGITSFRWSDTGPGWNLVLHRDEAGRLSRLVGSRGAYRLHQPQPAPLDELCDALATVPPGALRSIEILPTRTLGATTATKRRLEEVARRLGVEDCVCPG